MVESAARRDRIDSQAVTGWYLWEAPKKPACVYLSLDLIDKLEREVVENFRSLTSRGSEVGGILLGGVAPGIPASISIEDYEAIPCDYSRGPLYRLSDADLGRFERAIEQRSNGGNIQVVGFFRSHTRKGLALDAEDLAFLEAKFRNPYSLALLVRPFATKASVAGIFLREEAGFNSDASALEFPFRSSQLTPSKRGPELAAPPPAPTRAQVVPIATRREIATPPPPASSAVPPPEVTVETPKPAPAPEPKAAAPPVAPQASVAPAVEPEKPKAPPAPPSATPAPAAKSAVAPVKNAAVPAKNATTPAKPAPVATPAPPAAAHAKPKEAGPAPKIEAPKPESKKAEAAQATAAKPASKVPMLTGLLAAAILAFVLLFVYPGFLHHASKSPTAAVGQDTSPLTLRVEHTGTDLLLTWNRDSAAIRNATHATLSISDGDRHENYEMDLAQLRTGSIVYSPLGGDVSFQMEVVGRDQSRTATETLRLLQTRPSPMPAAGQDPKAAKTNSTQPQNNAQIPATPATTDSKDTPQPDETKQPSAPVKQFDASSLSGRLRPARAADLAEVPSPASASPVAPKISADSSLPFASLPGAPAAPPPPAPAPAKSTTPAPATTAPAASPASAKLDPSGGQIQPAQLITRKEPEYPLLARQMGAKGTVELIATIGADGAVKSVKVVKGHPLLIKAAQDAVMQWRYRPTLLNGVPVQNDTRITLNFVAQQ